MSYDDVGVVLSHLIVFRITSRVQYSTVVDSDANGEVCWS